MSLSVGLMTLLLSLPAADSLPVGAATSPPVTRPMALRAANGRLLGVAADGNRRAEVFLPGKPQMFELLHGGAAPIVLRDIRGNLFTTEEKDFTLYRLTELPIVLQSALNVALQTLAAQELTRKPYDKTDRREIRKTIRLPAPTLKQLDRMKEHPVLSTAEEYRVQAQVEGNPQVRLGNLPVLQEYRRPEARLLLFDVRATLPVRGHVQYRIPNLLDTSTGYRTVVHLIAVGEVAFAKSADKLSFQSPVVRDMAVELRDLRLSNDLLQVVRQGIQDILNHELRAAHDRIVGQANLALGKALAAKEFQHPLLRWLDLP